MQAIKKKEYGDGDGAESCKNWSCECGQENVAIFTSCRKCGKVKSGTTPGNVSNASLANMDRIAVCKGEEEYEGNEDGERISEE